MAVNGERRFCGEIGLAKSVHPEAGFLHDGRATTLQEAILWHGGEAEVAKERFRHFT